MADIDNKAAASSVDAPAIEAQIEPRIHPQPSNHTISSLAAAQVLEWRRVVDEEKAALGEPSIDGRRAIPERLKGSLHTALLEPLRACRPDLASWCRCSDWGWMPSLIIFDPEDGKGFELLASEALKGLSAEELATFAQLQQQFEGKTAREVLPSAVWDQFRDAWVPADVPVKNRQVFNAENVRAILSVFPGASVSFRGPMTAIESELSPWESFMTFSGLPGLPQVWIAAPRNVPPLADRGGITIPQTEEAIAKAQALFIADLEEREAEEARRQRRRAARRAENVDLGS